MRIVRRAPPPVIYPQLLYNSERESLGAVVVMCSGKLSVAEAASGNEQTTDASLD